MTTGEVLLHWRLLPCAVEARVRRIGWYQKIASEPENHVHILCALFGTAKFERSTPGLTALQDDFTLGPGANPWAKQFSCDMAALAVLCEGQALLEQLGQQLARVFCGGANRCRLHCHRYCRAAVGR